VPDERFAHYSTINNSEPGLHDDCDKWLEELAPQTGAPTPFDTLISRFVRERLLRKPWPMLVVTKYAHRKDSPHSPTGVGVMRATFIISLMQ
jgi:hypothetical protein